MGKSKAAVGSWATGDSQPSLDCSAILKLLVFLGITEFLLLLEIFSEDDLTGQVKLTYSKDVDKKDRQ